MMDPQAIEALAEAILADDGPRLPGDRRLAARAAAARDGVAVPAALLAEIEEALA